MPRLNWLGLRIMPGQGKTSRQCIRRWEVRDILPTYLRLRLNGVDVFAHLRTWESYEVPENESKQWLARRSYPNPDKNGLCEGQTALTSCFPFNPWG